MQDQKNLFLTIALSLLVFLVFNTLWPTVPPSVTAPPPAAGIPAPESEVPTVPRLDVARAPEEPVQATVEVPRIQIDSSAVSGSLSLQGGRIDDLALDEYLETLEPDSPQIRLLSPKGTSTPYYAEFGWVSANAADPVPGPDALWSSDADRLSPDRPVVLQWSNGQGLTFVRTISIDRRFMFSIADTVQNSGDSAVTLYPYGLISRTSTPASQGTTVLHEGPIGVFNNTLKEVSYSDLKDKGEITESSRGGWVGITDKYWLTAIKIPQEGESKARFLYRGNNGDKYQADVTGEGRVVPPGETISNRIEFFAGAKEVRLLDEYAETYNIPRFDLAVDFGWFYFLTKPFFFALEWLYRILGNFGLAIIAFTVILRLVMFPLANKSFKSMNRMKALQPKFKELQEIYGQDKVKLNQAMMALYKEHGVNPLSGCLPILIQIPIFFSLYKVLSVSLEMRHAPFYGWIQDLSAADPTNIFTLFGLIPWDPPSLLHLGVWPLIMGLTMWLQQKLNPAPTDPIQARIMMMLPLIFTVMLARFSAGLVIYWACNNTLSIAQQWVIGRRVAAADATAKQSRR